MRETTAPVAIPSERMRLTMATTPTPTGPGRWGTSQSGWQKHPVDRAEIERGERNARGDLQVELRRLDELVALVAETRAAVTKMTHLLSLQERFEGEVTRADEARRTATD